MAERVAPEFDCCECGRHIVVLCGVLPEPRVCGACMTMPGWFRYPAVRQLIDPEHDGLEVVDRAGLSPAGLVP